jgi:phosphatidylglycerol:prolipoprotein diacylglycerol transferase
MMAIVLKPIITIPLGPVTLFTWGFLVSLGIIAALIYLRLVSFNKGVSFDDILNISLLSIILGFIGARILFIFLEPNQFSSPTEIFRIWDGGLSSYGGLVLAVFGGIIYAKAKKINTLKLSDLIVPAVVLGFAISRIGCFLVNDHLGKITNFVWGINVNGTVRHPISAYYAISLFVLFIILAVFQKRFSKGTGFITFFALAWESAFRFIIDNFKDFEGRDILYLLNAIFLILIFIISFYFLIKRLPRMKTA